MNIVIVGGGTAGWIAAFYILKTNPNYNITVIESSNLGIIGAGEGGTHILGSILNNTEIDYGIDIKEFIIEADATFKQGVRHEHWTNSNSYYFNPLDLNFSDDPNINDRLAFLIANEQPIHPVSNLGMFIDQDRCLIKQDESGLAPVDGFSYHFDGNKVGKFFKRRVVEMGGIVVDAVEQNVVHNNTGGISSVVLSDNKTIQGDFLIDCTGFARVLMNQVGAKWISYKDNLLMNSAMPFLLEYEPPVWPKPVTLSRALSSGWMWQIPTIERFGCGYVFCDKFLSFDEAQKEIETILGRTIKPIKQIKFDSGRLDKPWNQNCLALGLASAFVEPLEATSIHATVIQIKKFVEYLDKNDSNRYNTEIGNMYDEIKDFIVLHYLSGKTGTPFWDYVNSHDIATEFVKKIINISKTRLLTKEDLPNKENSIGHQAWNQILAGLGFVSKEVAANYIKGREEQVKKDFEKWKSLQIEKMSDCKTNTDAVLYGYFTK
jgi:tryptophan halogenase